MKITNLLEEKRPLFSFEFFPPRSPRAEARLMETLWDLARLGPDFVSVTYGAGGSDRQNTLDLVARIKNDLGIEAMAHLTCVDSARHEIDETLRRLQAAGIENILALRGDPPQGGDDLRPPPGGFRPRRGADRPHPQRGGGTISAWAERAIPKVTWSRPTWPPTWPTCRPRWRPERIS